MATLPVYRQQVQIDCRPNSCPWRILRHGFNVEGICNNMLCPAYEAMVLVNVGFGEFDLSRTVLQETHRCPMCENFIRPIRYSLSHCRWWFVDHYSTHSYPLNTVNTDYECYNLTGEYIIIEVMPLPKKKMNPAIIRKSADFSCSICLIDLDTRDNFLGLECSHYFHRYCIEQWIKSNQSMADKCPLCRAYIVETD